jgi:hypothetical protein
LCYFSFLGGLWPFTFESSGSVFVYVTRGFARPLFDALSQNNAAHAMELPPPFWIQSVDDWATVVKGSFVDIRGGTDASSCANSSRAAHLTGDPAYQTARPFT